MKDPCYLDLPCGLQYAKLWGRNYETYDVDYQLGQLLQDAHSHMCWQNPEEEQGPGSKAQREIIPKIPLPALC
jgi:hypothetical protein